MKGIRYFIKMKDYIPTDTGFKSKEQFEEWIKEQFKEHGLDWRVRYAWKYKDSNLIYSLVNKKGIEIK